MANTHNELALTTSSANQLNAQLPNILLLDNKPYNLESTTLHTDIPKYDYPIKPLAQVSPKKRKLSQSFS